MRGKYYLADEAPAEAEVYGSLKFHRFEYGGKPACKAWRGRQGRPYAFYTFRSVERRELWIAEQKSSADSRAKMMEERKAQRKAELATIKQSLKVGMVLHGSWGYDQTNCELYQVVAIRGSKATIRAIAAVTVEDSEGFMSESLQADPNNFVGEPKERSIVPGGVKLHEHCTLYPVTNIEQKFYSSWYA